MNIMTFENILDEAETLIGLKLSDGNILSSLNDIDLFSKCATANIVIYGEKLAMLAVAIKGSVKKYKNRIYSGKIVWGKLTFVDLTDWKLQQLTVHTIEEMMNKYQYKTIPSKPSVLVIDEMTKAVSYSESLFLTKAKPNELDYYIYSGILNNKMFKKCYGGGLLGSPADSNKIYNNVSSWDVNSMYPWAAQNTLVPVSESIRVNRKNVKIYKNDSMLYISSKEGGFKPLNKYGYMGLFKATNIRRRKEVSLGYFNDRDEGIVEGEFTRKGLEKAKEVYFAGCHYTISTIQLQYEYDNLEILDISIHRLGMLPCSLRDFLNDNYIKKLEATNEHDRLKAKLCVNTTIGWMGTDPLKRIKASTRKGIKTVKDLKDNKMFKVYVGDFDRRRVGSIGGRRRIFDFRYGVYIINRAILRLASADKILGMNNVEVLYSDTDSIKFSDDTGIGDKIMNILNENIKTEHLGKWVKEDGYNRGACFKNIKLYAYEGDEGINLKMSGCPTDTIKDIEEAITLKDFAEANKLEVEVFKRSVIDLDNVDSFGSCKQYRNIKTRLIFGSNGLEEQNIIDDSIVKE